jgi:anti-sigma regulatory factor (Ser/Thr protein kinase)
VVALTTWLPAPGADEMRWLRVEDASAIAGCRNAALTLAGRLGFPAARGEELALAVSEAASNLHKHAREGTMLLRACRAPGHTAEPGAEVVTIDSGPGLAHIPAAVRDGHSTAGTLGIGLGAIHRLADTCDMYSRPGRGTVLAARFWPRPSQAHGPAGPPRQELESWAGLTRPITGETECGDSYGASAGAGNIAGVLTAVLCDGLGHGPLAAAAAREAVRVVREAPGEEPATLLERAHRSMGRTRGGAVAVVRIEGEAVRFAGLGNVAGWIVAGDSRRGMISVPGIAGHQARTIRQYDYRLPPGAVVILHSDGLSSRWDAGQLPGLLARTPLVIAAGLLSAAGLHRDDAGILVLRP